MFFRVSLTEASRRLARLRDKFRSLYTEDSEKMTKKETSSRRRTGAVNGIVAFQNQEPRKYKKKDLSLPFMDTVSISSYVSLLQINIDSNLSNW